MPTKRASSSAAKQASTQHPGPISWPVEYVNGFDQYRHYSVRRRQDMAFITTVQIVVVSLIGARLADLDLVAAVLSLFAGFVALMGLNNESRLSAHMRGYMGRVDAIERDHGLALLASDRAAVEGAKWVVRNTLLFPLYYVLILIMWCIVWSSNLYLFLNTL